MCKSIRDFSTVLFSSSSSLCSSLSQERFDQDEDKYLSGGDVYLLVYSVTDRRSFKKANELRFKLQRTKESETVPIILVGNKTDLERSREVSFAGTPLIDKNISDVQYTNTFIERGPGILLKAK